MFVRGLAARLRLSRKRRDNSVSASGLSADVIGVGVSRRGTAVQTALGATPKARRRRWVAPPPFKLALVSVLWYQYLPAKDGRERQTLSANVVSDCGERGVGAVGIEVVTTLVLLNVELLAATLMPGPACSSPCIAPSPSARRHLRPGFNHPLNRSFSRQSAVL
jgi:hypothetical protein